MDLNQFNVYTLEVMFFINVTNNNFVNMSTAIDVQVSYYRHACCRALPGHLYVSQKHKQQN